jgi:hypothetical protein
MINDVMLRVNHLKQNPLKVIATLESLRRARLDCCLSINLIARARPRNRAWRLESKSIFNAGMMMRITRMSAKDGQLV